MFPQQPLAGELQPAGIVLSGFEPRDREDGADVSQEDELTTRDSHNDLASLSEDVWAEEDGEVSALPS